MKYRALINFTLLPQNFAFNEGDIIDPKDFDLQPYVFEELLKSGAIEVVEDESDW